MSTRRTQANETAGATQRTIALDLVDGRDVAVDGAKLDTLETSPTFITLLAAGVAVVI